MSRGPRIVAGLGRPETAAETAARKAETSRKHRASQTTRNLVAALLASLGIVAVLILVVVRSDAPVREPIDYAAVGENARGSFPSELVVPELSSEWEANRAVVSRGSDGVATWEIGFVTPEGDYIQYTQAAEANATWLAQETAGARATGEATVGDAEWTVHDRREERDTGNAAYLMTSEIGASTFVLSGTAAEAEFEELAATVTELADTTGARS